MRTLVISDLHLGSRSRADVLRAERPRAQLAERLASVDRLVLLGDTLELRHGPARLALEAARPALEAIGRALPPKAEVVVVPGNHDHALAAPWLDRRLAEDAAPLRLEERVEPALASLAAAEVAGWLGAGRCTVAYPGIWLRDDVYATHGHYLDLHGTVPTFERLAAGAMTRLAGPLPSDGCGPDDYEALLAPLYAWIHSAAQRATPGRRAAGAGRSAQAWALLASDGHRPVGARILAGVLPLGIAAINRAGLGPVVGDLSGPALRRSSLTGMTEAIERLGIAAAHVVFGHSHRGGPLAGDDHGEWAAGQAGARLHNSGCWVYEPHFATGPPGTSPYWPGGAIALDDGDEPRFERLLADVPTADLGPDA
jgi:hypothetical protein